ncbi:MAG: hypothetical protein IKA79_02825 [Lentisphaeria bacterium]|nr:hypothetical protein [Lentisphaeria bacterium]
MEQRKKKILLWILGGSGAFLALLVLTGIILYFSVSSRLFEKPKPFEGPVLSIEDFSPLNTAGKKISNAFAPRNGILPASATLSFTEKETNALLHFSSQFSSMKTKEGSIRSRFHWKNGRLCVEGCYIYKNRPKGKNALNVYMEAIPYVDNGKIKLQLLTLKAGSLNTPGAFLGTAANHLVYRLEKHPQVLKYGKCVKKLSVRPDGGLDLVMDTNELMRLAGKVPRLK